MLLSESMLCILILGGVNDLTPSPEHWHAICVQGTVGSLLLAKNAKHSSIVILLVIVLNNKVQYTQNCFIFTKISMLCGL